MNNKNNKLRGYLRPEADEAQIEAWGWPEMETEAEVETNALGLAPDWYRQEQAPELPPDVPVEEPAPSITAEEVEAIRQAAWERDWAPRAAAQTTQRTRRPRTAPHP